MKTQGTQLYFISPLDGTLYEVGCPTSISGLDSSRDQIETTCLSSPDRTYESGLKTPSQMTFAINVDPRDPSHVLLKTLHDSGETVQWALGLSGPNQSWLDIQPTVDSSGEFVNGGDRVFLVWDGYVSSFPFNAEVNTVYQSTVGVQVSGPVAWFLTQSQP